MPIGVISFRRVALRHQDGPLWNDSNTNLVDLSLLNGKKIEDIPNTLQVDFANKYIVRNQTNVKNIDLRID